MNKLLNYILIIIIIGATLRAFGVIEINTNVLEQVVRSNSVQVVEPVPVVITVENVTQPLPTAIPELVAQVQQTWAAQEKVANAPQHDPSEMFEEKNTLNEVAGMLSLANSLSFTNGANTLTVGELCGMLNGTPYENQKPNGCTEQGNQDYLTIDEYLVSGQVCYLLRDLNSQGYPVDYPNNCDALIQQVSGR